MSNIYEDPQVAYWMQAERDAITEDAKRHAHNEMIAAMKAIQIAQGQRTRDNYGKA